MKINALSIRENRKKLGFSQSQLANLIGVSPNTILNYEKGKPIPDSKKELLRKVLFEPLGEEKEVIQLESPETVLVVDENVRAFVDKEIKKETDALNRVIFELYKRVNRLEAELNLNKGEDNGDSERQGA